ncbi:MAG TPA: ATP synthase subunit I [Desulfomicrobiaceae bacterium]|nr:ATP synthase subunit I [Desulfomicrobiaceae bacterium]
MPEVRRLVQNQVYLALLCLPLLGGWKWFPWGGDLAVGVLLGTLNFYALATFVQQLVLVQKGAVTAQLISFYGRLFLTAAVLYGLIVWNQSSVTALLVGLSSVIVNILIWGAFHYLGKKLKEA